MKPSMLALLLLAVFVGTACRPPPAEAPEKAVRTFDYDQEMLDLAASLPVLDGGRVKPFSTFARFSLLPMNGSTKAKIHPRGEEPKKLSATAWLLDCLFFPEQARHYAVFQVRTSEVLTDIGLSHEGKRKADRYSYAEIEPGVDTLLRKASQYDQIPAKDRDPVETQVVHLAVNFTQVARPILHRQVSLVPPLHAGDKDWFTLASLVATEPGMLPSVYAEMRGAVLEMDANRTDPAKFKAGLKKLHDLTTDVAIARGEYSKIPLEVHYYNFGYMHWALGFFGIAFVLAAFMFIVPRGKWLYLGTWTTMLIALAALVAGIAVRCIIRGRPPVSTLYETILFIVAVIVIAALFVEFVNRRRIPIGMSAFLGLLGMFLAMRYELKDGKDTMPALMAVLDTNFWLATHVTTVTMGYGAGLLAGTLGIVYVVLRYFTPERRENLRSLAKVVYGVLCFGLFFSVLGTILGGIWANDSWGRFWGWDPKENGALMIVLWELAILHARRGGYIKSLGFAVATILGNIIIAFSWWGVNLLGVGLHSYGFTSGIQRTLHWFYASQALFAALGAIVWFRDREAGRVEDDLDQMPADALEEGA